MAETMESTGVVTLEYAKEQDVVWVEVRPYNGKHKEIIPAKIVEVSNGYEIMTFGLDAAFRLSKEGYGKTWRCWEIRKPSMIDRRNVPWG